MKDGETSQTVQKPRFMNHIILARSVMYADTWTLSGYAMAVGIISSIS